MMYDYGYQECGTLIDDDETMSYPELFDEDDYNEALDDDEIIDIKRYAGSLDYEEDDDFLQYEMDDKYDPVPIDEMYKRHHHLMGDEREPEFYQPCYARFDKAPHLPAPIPTSTSTKKFKLALPEFSRYIGAGLMFYRQTENGIEVLLEKRSPHMKYPDLWTIPGGGFEPLKDDLLKDTALREASEEICGGASLDEFRAGLKQIKSVKLPWYRYDTFICYLKTEIKLVPQAGEVSKIRWFNIDELPIMLHPEAKRVLRKFKRTI